MQYCEIKKLIADKRVGKWWEKADEEKDGIKWTTMRHNGVLFAPEYEPLPKNVKILYNNIPTSLDSTNTANEFGVSAEEAAYFFAMKLEQDDRLSEKKSARHKAEDDSGFVKNFWKDWKVILGKNTNIKDWNLVDFTPIKNYISKKSAEKKESQKKLSKEEKASLKDEKEELKEIYGYAIVDGVKIPLGNYMIQPPGLYIGHGTHPLRGRIKGRVRPEEVTLNISRNQVPICRNRGQPCKWGEIVEDHSVTWIASYRHPITKDVNYVWLKREESHFVCADDMIKFDKARKLKNNIEKVRAVYRKDLFSNSATTRQLATAVFLLDVLAIRPGIEKDESTESDTVGLTTLKCSNIKFLDDNIIRINFIGKSSIEFVKKIKIPEQPYKNLKQLCMDKDNNDFIFDYITANTLNDYLKTLLPEITAKVFRTFKASSILQEELNKNIPKADMDAQYKKLIYDKANIAVAKALNHKKMGDSDAKIEKLKNKIVELEAKLENAKTSKQQEAAKKAIETASTKLEEATNNISLSTSKVNYLDPRISISWAKKGEVPIEKIYNKTQLQKFVWAMDTSSKFEF